MTRRTPYTLCPAAFAVLAPIALTMPTARADGPSFTGIGFLPGGSLVSSSSANAVAPDGSVVAGTCNRAPISPFSESIRWTRADGIQGMGLPSGIQFSTGAGVSLGGAFICGYHENLSLVYRAYRWSSAAGAYQDLGAVPGGFPNSFAQGISRDGKTVVGFGRVGIAGNGLGFIWRDGVGMFSLGDLPGGAVNSVALGVSGDGQVAVGSSDDAESTRPVMWREGAGLTVLPDLPGGTNYGAALTASNDGRFIAGFSNTSRGYEAALWKDYGTVAVTIGDLPGGSVYSIATGLTDDSSMVVGYSNAAAGERGFIWDAAHGIRDAKTVLQTQYGLNLAGWTIGRVDAISADGRVLVGEGTDPRGNFQGWVAVIPSPGACLLLLSALPMSAGRRRR